jgi:hypothetical protein
MSRPPIIRRISAYTLNAALAGAILAGCAEPQTQFEIVNLKGVNEREHFSQQFDECFYTIGRGGRIDLVARRTDPGSGGGRVTQLIHLKTEYTAVPGTTHAEESMINATVHYAVLDGQGGVCYEGAGFVSTEELPDEGLMLGALERAKLDENRRVGQGSEVFERVDLTGTYRAVRSRRRVVALLNELNRVFGLHPDYRPEPRYDDPL